MRWLSSYSSRFAVNGIALLGQIAPAVRKEADRLRDFVLGA